MGGEPAAEDRRAIRGSVRPPDVVSMGPRVLRETATAAPVPGCLLGQGVQSRHQRPPLRHRYDRRRTTVEGGRPPYGRRALSSGSAATVLPRTPAITVIAPDEPTSDVRRFDRLGVSRPALDAMPLGGRHGRPTEQVLHESEWLGVMRRRGGSSARSNRCGEAADVLVLTPSDTRATRVDTFQAGLGPAELRAGPFCVPSQPRRDRGPADGSGVVLRPGARPNAVR